MLDIIYPGKNKTMDQLIDLLQWNLLKKNPVMKVGGEDGMILSRSAFAVNLSLSQYEESCSYTNLMMLLDQLEMSLASIDSNLSVNQANKHLTDELKSVSNIQPLFEKWESSSKMRIWLQEKKKDISNKVAKEAEQLNKQAEGTEETNKSESDIQGIDEDEEIIDTNSKPDLSSVKNCTIGSETGLKEKEKQEIETLVKKVCDKAELLIKIKTPFHWRQSADSATNLRLVTENSMVSNKNEPLDILQRIKSIREIQTSKGTINNFEKLKNREVFNSCSTSVLAALQCSLTSEEILEAIELRFVNALNRYCGLKLFNELTADKVDSDTMKSILNWF